MPPLRNNVTGGVRITERDSVQGKMLVRDQYSQSKKNWSDICVMGTIQEYMVSIRYLECEIWAAYKLKYKGAAF